MKYVEKQKAWEKRRARIVELHNAGESLREIGRRYRISGQRVFQILNPEKKPK